MNSRPDQFQADIVFIKKTAQERNHNCLAFIIQGFFSSIFLFILEKNLVVLQIPIVLAFIILYIRPSLCKELLSQQYLGLAAVILNVLKIFFLIINAVIFLVSRFTPREDATDNNAATTIYKASGIVEILPENPYLYPNIGASDSAEVSTFVGGVLILVFALLTLFELLSLYVIFFIIKKTIKIISKIKNLSIPDRPVSGVSAIGGDLETHPNNRTGVITLRSNVTLNRSVG